MVNFKEWDLKRLRIPISVEYSLDTEVEILPVSYLGLSGMFVETSLNYPVGVNVVVRFYIPQFDKVVEAVGEVVANIKEDMDDKNWGLPGILVKFKAMEDKDKDYLKTFLSEMAV